MKHQVTKVVTAVYVSDLEASKAFYSQLLNLNVIFESDWIVQLSSNANESINLTLQPRSHELIPTEFQKAPQGVSIAFVVPSCDEVYSEAVSMGLKIILEPRNEDYGQRRFLTVDPDGLLVDVCSACEPSADFIAKYMSSEP